MSVRIIYTDGENLSNVDSVRQNPGKIFAVIGPFESHIDQPNLQADIEELLIKHNEERSRTLDYDH